MLKDLEAAAAFTHRQSAIVSVLDPLLGRLLG
jgi:hypothetical protein